MCVETQLPLVVVKCILGYLAVPSPQKSRLMPACLKMGGAIFGSGPWRRLMQQEDRQVRVFNAPRSFTELAAALEPSLSHQDGSSSGRLLQAPPIRS